MPKQPIAALIEQGASITDILGAYTPDQIQAALGSHVEDQNKAAQLLLNYPAAAQGPVAWRARKAWLLDGQPIHGQASGLAEYYFPALAALRNDDQAEFARQKDLLFKAVRTFLGDSAQ